MPYLMIYISHSLHKGERYSMNVKTTVSSINCTNVISAAQFLRFLDLFIKPQKNTFIYLIDFNNFLLIKFWHSKCN